VPFIHRLHIMFQQLKMTHSSMACIQAREVEEVFVGYTQPCLRVESWWSVDPSSGMGMGLYPSWLALPCQGVLSDWVTVSPDTPLSQHPVSMVQ
jgi:hypothetical protein